MLKIMQIENIDYITCPICQKKVKALTTSGHLKMHNIARKELIKLFPDQLLFCKNTSIKISNWNKSNPSPKKGKFYKRQEYEKTCKVCNKKYITLREEQQACCTKCARTLTGVKTKGLKRTSRFKINCKERQINIDYEERYGVEKANEIRKKLSISQSKRKRNSHTKETKKKLRKARIRQIEKNYGKCEPNFNPNACKIFKEFDEINNTQGRYAMYGNGEKLVKGLHYYLDYFNEDLKLIIEIDEYYHENEIQKAKDIVREDKIKKLYPDFKFLRFKDTKMKEILEVKV